MDAVSDRLDERTLRILEIATSLPTEDQDVLRKLSTREIPDWALAMADEYHKRIAQLTEHIATVKTLHNYATSPIHSLPTEILMRIFEEACTRRKDVVIASVCRLWRSVILSMPKLWVTVLANTKLEVWSDRKAIHFLRMVAPRCHTCPLTLRVHGFCSAEGDFAMTVVGIAANIDTLHVEFYAHSSTDQDLSPLNIALRSGMTQLKHLRITLGGASGSHMSDPGNI